MERFERLRAGESLSALVAEAETAALEASKAVVASKPETVVAAVEADIEDVVDDVVEDVVEDAVAEQES